MIIPINELLQQVLRDTENRRLLWGYAGRWGGCLYFYGRYNTCHKHYFEFSVQGNPMLSWYKGRPMTDYCLNLEGPGFTRDNHFTSRGDEYWQRVYETILLQLDETRDIKLELAQRCLGVDRRTSERTPREGVS